MSNVRVCTLMWGTAWERYGQIFAETFTKYWDDDIEIVTVVDNNIDFPRSKQILLQELDAYKQFNELWEKHPFKKDLKRDKDFWKWNPPHWMPQGITPNAVLEANTHWVDGDILVWLDADCEFNNNVTSDWIEEILGDYDCAALQRKPKHTEIGFYALRLNADTRAAMKQFSDHYATHSVEQLGEWHSAFVWDDCIDSNENIRVKNLTAVEDRGSETEKAVSHVFVNSVLSKCIVHKKGKRKDKK